MKFLSPQRPGLIHKVNTHLIMVRGLRFYLIKELLIFCIPKDQAWIQKLNSHLIRMEITLVVPD